MGTRFGKRLTYIFGERLAECWVQGLVRGMGKVRSIGGQVGLSGFKGDQKESSGVRLD